MKLQFLIPHYHEDFSVLKPLLDSIALQQNVDFNEIGVVICSDGDDAILDEKNFTNYPFQIEYHVEPHKGVSATRNACLDYATAEYVMFCDADDMFFNACGLFIVFNEINNAGFDSLVSTFVEETRNSGNVFYISHEMDSTFVHGKVHRRQYLIDNDIRWNENLTIHEDSFFNILAQNCSSNVKYCPTAFYLWKWRDDSVCRHDDKYILKTYKNMIDSNDALIDEFLKRGKKDKASFFVAFLIFDAYYNMNKPEWINQDNKQYRDDTEKRFALYYAKHKNMWLSLGVQEKMIISNQIRTRSVGEGMLMESITIDKWLEHIEK